MENEDLDDLAPEELDPLDYDPDAVVEEVAEYLDALAGEVEGWRKDWRKKRRAMRQKFRRQKKAAKLKAKAEAFAPKKKKKAKKEEEKEERGPAVRTKIVRVPVWMRPSEQPSDDSGPQWPSDDEPSWDDQQPDFDPEAELYQDVSEMAGSVYEFGAEQVIAAARRQLGQIRKRMKQRRMDPEEAMDEGQETHRAARRSMRRLNRRAFGGSFRPHRAAFGRASAFGGVNNDDDYAACLIAGLEQCGKDVIGGIVGDEDDIGFVLMAAKAVGKGVGKLVSRMRSGAKALREKRRAKKEGGKAPSGYGQLTQMGPDIMMSAQAGKEAVAIDLGQSFYLVAVLTQGSSASANPMALRAGLLGNGQRLLAEKGPAPAMAGLLSLRR